MQKMPEDPLHVEISNVDEPSAALRQIQRVEEWIQRRVRHPRLLGVGATTVLALLFLLLVLRSALPVSELPAPARLSDFPPSTNLFSAALDSSIPGVMVVSEGGVLTALHQGTGTAIWHYKEVHGVWGMPQFSRGTVFVNTRDGRVVALDGATGKAIWFHSKRLSSASVLQVGDGIVFIRDQDLRTASGRVVALRISDGSLLWQHFTFHFTRFVVDNRVGTAYIGDAEGRITAIRIGNGAFLWGEYTRAWNWMNAYGSLIYVATWDGTIAALHAGSGTTLWQTHLRVGASGAPLIGERAIVVPTTDGGMSVLDADTGSERWTSGGEPLAMTGELVYSLTSDGRMSVRRTSNGVLLRLYEDIESVFPSEPGGAIFAVTARGELVALRAQSGTVLWQWSSPSPIVALSPARSLVYVSTSSDRVLALRVSNGSTYWNSGVPVS